MLSGRSIRTISGIWVEIYVFDDILIDIDAPYDVDRLRLFGLNLKCTGEKIGATWNSISSEC